MKRLLLVGELAYNPERVRWFASRGWTLSGRWIADPLPFMTVGPLPYVAEEDADGPLPDAVLALLNWRAVPVALDALRWARRRGVPIAWVFKEAPQRALVRGTWAALLALHAEADVVAYCSEEERAYMALAAPGVRDDVLVLDGDLPLSAVAGSRDRAEGPDGVHTVLAGRAYGFSRSWLDALAAAEVHLHVHAGRHELAPSAYVHLHEPVPASSWVSVLGGYDAGWLHPHVSSNGGDLRRAVWDDLNVPARFATYLAAGLPVVQPANAGHRVATQSLVRRYGCGVLVEDVAELRDGARLAAARDAAVAAQSLVAFDVQAAELERRLTELAGWAGG